MAICSTQPNPLCNFKRLHFEEDFFEIIFNLDQWLRRRCHLKIVLILGWEPFVQFLFCLAFAMSLCASVYMCFVVTCWERADLLSLVCGVYCEFVTYPLVSWVRCGT